MCEKALWGLKLLKVERKKKIYSCLTIMRQQSLFIIWILWSFILPGMRNTRTKIPHQRHSPQHLNNKRRLTTKIKLPQ